MDDFIAYLDSRIEEGKTKTAELLAEGCRDDANLSKVRTNIYDICKTVSRALLNRPGAVKVQLERLHTEWSASLEKAKQYDNVNGIVVEETKLSALDDIIAHFQEVAEA